MMQIASPKARCGPGAWDISARYNVSGTHGTIGLEEVKEHVKSVMLKTWDSLEDEGKSLHRSKVRLNILMLDSALRGLTK